MIFRYGENCEVEHKWLHLGKADMEGKRRPLQMRTWDPERVRTCPKGACGKAEIWAQPHPGLFFRASLLLYFWGCFISLASEPMGGWTSPLSHFWLPLPPFPLLPALQTLWSSISDHKTWISEKPLWGIFRKNSGPVASPGWSGPCKLRESAPAAHLLWAWTPFLCNKW